MSDIALEIRLLLCSCIETIINEGEKIVLESQRSNPSIEFLCEATHKIKGGSGTAGFMDLYRIADSLNEDLKSIRDSGSVIDKNIRNKFDEFQRTLGEVKPESSTLLKKYI